MGWPASRLNAFVDSNVLVRHLTGDPPDQARRSTEFLRSGEALILTDTVVAEAVYVLESVYEVERVRVAELVRAVVGFPAVVVADGGLLLRTLEIYQRDRIHFAECYLAASAELSGVGVVASFDRDIDRVPTIRRLEPGAHESLLATTLDLAEPWWHPWEHHVSHAGMPGTPDPFI